MEFFFKLNVPANYMREYRGLKILTKPREKSVIHFGFGVGMMQTGVGMMQTGVGMMQTGVGMMQTRNFKRSVV
jgi:hypothetical protein